MRGTKDPALLDLAAELGRVLITHDRNSMIGYLKERLAAGRSSPGIFLVPNRPEAVGAAIEYLLLVWGASQAEEWCEQMIFVPSR